MIPYETKDIRTIVLLGHGASGKTSLVESMLYKAGATTRLGSVEACTAIGRDVKSISSIRQDTLILFEIPSPLLLQQKQPSLLSPPQTAFKSTLENYGIWPVKKDW